ncbi:hypothetical protein C6P40_003447 [Pichia californica]|uniref:Xylanolytic transcriptional activator regulatory domain-containing protein n=1 Tax=Pichia californica TaxID=460514 RepID=A0A9P6WNL5_9ASCO|nr:hypothetical protein C6P42_002535 [[Candida] californica]KAG0690251.1 hypothetical protein C6P40_003447 [[Candida] californica]
MYVKLLEEKVSYLEGLIEEMNMDNKFEERNRDETSPSESVSTNQSSGSVESVTEADILTKCAALFPLKDDMEPLYVGSSGLNIASLLQAHLKLEIADALQKNSFPTSSNYDAKLNDYVSRSLDDLLYEESKLNYFVETYAMTIHKKYPFLNYKDIISLHKNREYLLRNDKVHNEKIDIIHSFILLMVYAIGSMMVSRNINQIGISNPSYKNDNFVFFTSAMKLDLSVVFEHKSVLNIHSMLLTVIYQLRLPNGPVIWDMIGFALRLCVNFGFHRKNINLLHTKPFDYQQRILTFWSTYSLERSVSSSFGRPFSLSDRDIDVDLPIDIDESVVDESLIKKEYFKGHSNVNSIVTSRTHAIHHFKFIQIESEIQNQIYRVDVEVNDIPKEEIYKLISKMKQWASTIPPSSSSDYDYYLYLYNKQIRYLIQPFLSKLTKDDSLFIECMTAASTVCQLNKRIYQNTKIRLSFISLQTVFLSGVTLIYGLLSKKVNWNFSVSEGLRCCSGVLFSVAQRAYTCAIFSEIFEKLVTMVHEKEIVNEKEKNNGVTLKFNEIHDLFGQNELRQNVHDSHSKENLEVFNEISLKDENLRELENLFDFTNLDLLGTDKLDELVKKTSSSTQFLEDNIFLEF